MKKFTRDERSSFKYFFAHWCAYQMVALNLRVWKPKHLLHDIEKPWLMLWWNDYKRVQKWHRTHNAHHLQYPGEKDWLGMVIDWECSRFTKEAEPLNARETLDHEYNKFVRNNEEAKAEELLKNMLPILNKLGL